MNPKLTTFRLKVKSEDRVLLVMKTLYTFRFEMEEGIVALLFYVKIQRAFASDLGSFHFLSFYCLWTKMFKYRSKSLKVLLKNENQMEAIYFLYSFINDCFVNEVSNEIS